MDFDYALPDALIAKDPPARREDARLLHWSPQGQIGDRSIVELPDLIPEGSAVWANETRVLHARLMAVKPTGGVVELLLLEPRDVPVEQALTARSSVVWNALIGGAKKWKQGSLSVPDSGVDLSVTREDGALAFTWSGDEDFGTVLDRLGRIPLPPYMRREAGAADLERYQTVFARFPGSVAAPTAGLHLTPDMFEAMADRDILCGKVTLHVGVGTFKPLSGALDAHIMHGERCIIQSDALRGLAEARSLTAVGTTTLRTLESLYWLACRWRDGGAGPEGEIAQWIHKEVKDPFGSFQEAVEWMLGKWDQDRPLEFVTHLMIVPGYRVRSVQRLLTNFHMPNSTLLCIVEAMIGEGWRRAYAHAVEAEYRFLSYGDACLLERPI